MWHTLLALLTITFCGACVRYLPVHESLWLDELHTSWTVSGRFSDVQTRAAQGNQSPLYFWGVWGIARLLGQSELTLRLLSLCAGVLLIPAVFIVATRWSGSLVAGLLAAALVATQQQFLFYSTEARPYALVQLVGLGQIALFARVHAGVGNASGTTTPSILARLRLIASSTVLFYLHYTAALVFLAEAAAFFFVMGMTALRKKHERFSSRVAAFSIDFAGVAVLCLPAARALGRIAANRKQWDVLPASLPLVEIGHVMVVCVAFPLVFAVSAGVLRYGLGKRPSLHQPGWNASILTFSWMLLPGLFVVACRQWANLALLRYIIVSAAAPMVLAGLIVATHVDRRIRAAVAVVVVAAAVLSAPWLGALLQNQRVVPDRNENWRELVAMINSSQASEEEPVFVCSGLLEDARLTESADTQFREYCLFSVSGIYALDRRRRTVYPIPTNIPKDAETRLTKEGVRAIEFAGGAWLIVRGPGFMADQVEHDLLSMLRKSGLAGKRRSRHAFGLLTAIWIGLEA